MEAILAQWTLVDADEAARVLARTYEEWMQKRMDAWFSRKRSKEVVMRSTKNEISVLETTSTMTLSARNPVRSAYQTQRSALYSLFACFYVLTGAI